MVHAHDHFFRMAMRKKRVAKEFFEAHLPADLCRDINLSEPEMEPGSYINDRRRESIADILFKTEIKGHNA